MHARERRENCRVYWAALCAALTWAVFGCGDDDTSFETRRSGDGGFAGSAGDGENGDGRDGDPVDLTDDQIVGVMIAAHAAEIMHGEIAVQRASAPAVVAFGRRMVDEHSAAVHALGALVDTTALEWDTSPEAEQLSANAADTAAELRQLDRAQFDAAYLRAQHALHVHMLSVVDTLLLPSVVDPLLEARLVAMRAEVTDHLLAASALLDALAADAGAP